MVDIEKLPLGDTYFSDFIENQLIYVDKTDLIAQLAKFRTPIFLSRPRRFGKSTLVNTFEELFSNGLKKFKGLKIDTQNLWQDKTYEVIHLDFSSIEEAIKIKKTKETEAQKLLDSIDNYLFNELGIKVEDINIAPIKNRIFTINFNELERERLDSDYFDEKYKRLLNCIHEGKYNLKKLSSITSFLSTGQTPKSDCYKIEKTDFPIIKVGSYSGFEIDLNKVAYTIDKQPYSIKKGDIFILSSAHQAEYIAKQIYYLSDIPMPNTSFVGELLCLRANESVNSMYLYSLLSTKNELFIQSRVVPSILETMLLSLFINLFNKLDFPTLGRPIIEKTIFSVSKSTSLSLFSFGKYSITLSNKSPIPIP